MSWENCKLSDLATLITKGTTPSNIGESFTDKGIPYIRSELINSGKYISDGELLFISTETHEKLKRSQLKAKDILFSMAGIYLGKTAILRENDVRANTNQAVALIRLDPGKCCVDYIYYYLNLPSVVELVNRINGQSAQPNINLKQIGNLDIMLPPFDVQCRIADILSAYDYLIENNQKQIKLLEEAAQRLYKEWFVDLRFPGHETTPIINGIPEGWTTATLDEICTLRKETLTPDKIPNGIPYIGLEHMPRKDICLAEWGDSSEVSSNKFAYYEDDILFGKIRPYFHKVGFALNSGVSSTDSIVMVAKDGLWSLLLMVVSSTEFVDFSYQNCKEGSKMPRADWSQMRQYGVLIADPSTMGKFNELIFDMTRRIKALAIQNRLLTEARDRLLPKLMNGEIEV